MSAASHAAGGGVVLGIVGVLLLQQFNYLDLTSLSNALLWVIVGAVVGGIVFALIGWGLGKRYARVHPDAAPDAK